MTQDYFDNYIYAVEHPLPELKLTFEKELDFLKQHVKDTFVVLDVRCGIGRPSIVLAPFVRKMVGIDNNKWVFDVAIVNSISVKNIEFLRMNILNMDFPNERFDLTYSTYNIIGSIEKSERQTLINEMARVTKNGGKIINITWKNDKETTEFLRKYYPSIDIGIIHLDDTKTITTKGTFDRLSKEELLEYYKNANLKQIEFIEIGPLWLAIIGVK